MRGLLTRILVLLTTCAVMFCASADVYKWVDEEGNVHYGDQPQENAQEMKIKEGNVTPSENEDRYRRQQKVLDAFTHDRQQKNTAHEKAEAEKAKKDAKCADARARFEKYVNAQYLYRKSENNERDVLDDQEREQALKKMQADIKQHCD